MNSENTNITGIPSVTDYITQANKIDTLNRTNGQLIQQITDLKKNITDLESKQPQVKVIHTNRTDNVTYWGISDPIISFTSPGNEKVEYLNLSTVEEKIRKDLEAKYEEELNNLKKLQIELKNAKEDRSLLIQEHERDMRLLSDAEQKDREDIIREKNEKIEKLQSDYKKLKDNNTDTAKELRRKMEIEKLQKQIKLLTSENSRLNRLSLFGKLFNSKARTAEREFKLKLAELQQTVYTLFYDPEQEIFW